VLVIRRSARRRRKAARVISEETPIKSKRKRPMASLVPKALGVKGMRLVSWIRGIKRSR